MDWAQAGRIVEFSAVCRKYFIIIFQRSQSMKVDLKWINLKAKLCITITAFFKCIWSFNFFSGMYPYSNIFKKSLKVFRLKAAILGLWFVKSMMFNYRNPREPKGTQGNPREPKGTQALCSASSINYFGVSCNPASLWKLKWKSKGFWERLVSFIELLQIPNQK